MDLNRWDPLPPAAVAELLAPLDRPWWIAGGLRHVRPEVQLLFKAKSPRPKDEADFAACLPALDGDAPTSPRIWTRTGSGHRCGLMSMS